MSVSIQWNFAGGNVTKHYRITGFDFCKTQVMWIPIFSKIEVGKGEITDCAGRLRPGLMKSLYKSNVGGRGRRGKIDNNNTAKHIVKDERQSFP